MPTSTDLDRRTPTITVLSTSDELLFVRVVPHTDTVEFYAAATAREGAPLGDLIWSLTASMLLARDSWNVDRGYFERHGAGLWTGHGDVVLSAQTMRNLFAWMDGVFAAFAAHRARVTAES